MNRRKLLAGFSLAIAASSFNQAEAGGVLSAPEAQKQAQAGKILLLDIRTPEEWAKTGSGVGAKRLDMRRDDFVAALDTLLGGDRSKPVALICAKGVRSSRLSRALREGGYSNIIDVPEGMMGSYAGPGWLARGLPVVK
jgi:rhodanese-related sulfurtransferase